ncbi:MAG: hypothetical protein LC723_11070 [Actinobacteria bacterium]|nr:hypothetical protein [Actinomycetota bacterium]
MIAIRTKLRERARGTHEQGSALILALIFLLFFSLIIGAVLAFGDTSIRQTLAISSQRSAVYDADGAVEAAINNIRKNASLGRSGGACPTFTMTDGNGTTTTVTCAGLAGSGASAGGAGSKGIDFPNFSLLTLGEFPITAEDGISAGSNGTKYLDGDVFSNTNINPNPGSFTVTGSVSARLGCTGTITATGTKNCGAGSSQPDPGYAPRITVQPPTGTVSSPCGANHVLTFVPGSFSGTQLNNAFNSCPGSANPKMYFPPGTYYFDFTDISGSWTIPNKATIIGGLANGWDPLSLTEPTVPFPGGCRNDVPGTQFIFGKQSRFTTTQAGVEVCAGTNVPAGGQQIAIYGVGPKAYMKPTSATNTGSVSFTVTSSALSIDGATSDVTLTTNGSSGQLRLTGYATSTLVPAGSIIDALILRVAHSETNPGKVTTLKVTTTVGTTSNVTNLSPSNPLHEDDLDLTSNFTSSNFNNGVTVTFGAVRGTGGSDPVVSLDGAQMLLSYHAPGGLPSQTGCILVTAGCSMITTSGSPNIGFNGTFYAPGARLDLHLTSTSNQVFGRGAVLRSVVADITPSCACPLAAFQLPQGGGAPADRKVLFEAKVTQCDITSGCTTRSRLRSVVIYSDLAGTNPGSTVTVTSWSIIR